MKIASRVLCLALCLGAVLVPAHAAEPQVEITRQQWEYYMLYDFDQQCPPYSMERLNQLGAEGWEVVGVINPSPLAKYPVLLLKRPR